MNVSAAALAELDSNDLPLDDLLRLQLKVARRADELARLQQHDIACDYWHAAERELLPDLMRLRA